MLRSRLMVGIAGLCLVAQFAALAHLVVTQHARCAEHGEVVHARDHAGTDAAGALRDGAPTETVRASSEAADAHDDDHCGSLTERRDLRWFEPPAVASLRSTTAAEAPPRRATPSIVRALYRLAPKNSPPRTA